MFTKDFWGFLTVALTLVGYAPYLHGIHRGRIRPHLFSWVVWTMANGVAFGAQIARDAGPGAWFTGVTALICLAIVLMSARGEKNITLTDTVALIGGLAAIPVWYFTRDPLWAVILASAIDLIGTWPTIRKSYRNPGHEALFMWVVAAGRPLLSLPALETYSATTLLFPLALCTNNLVVIAVIVWRRAALKPKPS